MNVAAYTLAGSLASSFVGGILGWLGGLVLPEQAVSQLRLFVALGVAGLVLARELEVISLRLPQLKRQTDDMWAKIFPGIVAATLWGIDLGLIFTTWLGFSGIWLLVVATFLIGEPKFGIGLFVLYWFGRALSVWVAPFLLPHASATSQLLNGVRQQYRLFHRTHILGISWSIVVLILWLYRGG